jgi:hypothetical protein
VEELARVRALYAERQWGAAADAAAAVIPGLPAAQRPEAELYRGIALLLDGRALESLPPLGAAGAGSDPDVAVRASWCSAQAYLVLDDPEAARPILDDLSQTPEFARAAAEQLLRIRRLRPPRESSGAGP